MRASLYHAISFEHCLDVFRLNALTGHSTHRLHPNGTVPWPGRTETGKIVFTPEYLESEWFFGVCLTRDASFARQWNSVVLELDQDALRTRHKLVPYNWMETRTKAEAEEFLPTGKAGFAVKNSLTAVKDNSRVRRNLRKLTAGSVGAVPNISRYIKSIEIVADKKHTPNMMPLRAEAEESHNRWRFERYAAFDPFLNGYCRAHNIPMRII